MTAKFPIEEINARAIALARDALAAGVVPEVSADRLLFVTISGAHLYGFPSPDSDLDLRAAHLLPLRQMIGLGQTRQTVEVMGRLHQGVELDFVSHDLHKYLGMLLSKNGYVLEQIFSPLVVHDSGHLAELRQLAAGATTRQVRAHYRGSFHHLERAALAEQPPRVKTMLYIFRVLGTGLVLLRSGRVEANLCHLVPDLGLPYLADWIARKQAGTETGTLDTAERDAGLTDARRLLDQLDLAARTSSLPEDIPNRAAIEDFLVRLRLADRL